MTARPGVRGEPTLLVSFDGGVRERTVCHRPDRYRLLESDVDSRARIARGGGYSYAAASFGGESVTVEMQRFNRILGFDPARRTIEVEAGVTLGELLAVTARAGLWLAVQPGYSRDHRRRLHRGQCPRQEPVPGRHLPLVRG
jgi:hypothetical protein